ncbi:MAG TPA: hypothetical protein VN699_07365 [Pirellulales bacterium]|jgi:hypothetical protein|nr:hypothetical protein [Pirellulales bacterium]HXT58435.1 hypothetical protein [Pirellulales bacterium]
MFVEVAECLFGDGPTPAKAFVNLNHVIAAAPRSDGKAVVLFLFGSQKLTVVGADVEKMVRALRQHPALSDKLSAARM